jgi:hypothetical protein
MTLTRTRRSFYRLPGEALRGTLRAWAPLAALRPSGPRRRRRASRSPRPAAPAGRRNDQGQARELQKRAILPALQCEAGQRSPARALRVTRDGLRPPLRLIFPDWSWRQLEGWPVMVGVQQRRTACCEIVGSTGRIPLRLDACRERSRWSAFLYANGISCNDAS